MSLNGVFNMPSGVPFLGSLALGLKAELGDDLSRALILLPTRRAVRGLTDIFMQFAKESEKGVMFLPRLNTLADIDPNEPPFEPNDVAGLVPASIDPVQRRFEMARVIEQFYRRTSDLPLDAAAALSLADPLLSIIDDAAAEEVKISDLAKLKEIQVFAAEHFQYQAELYKIIQTYWPQRLKELEALEPKSRQVRVLDTLTQQWENNPPDYPIIIAGSTGTLGATARLMSCVSRLPRGMIILPGLDNSPDRSWDGVAEQHPQNALKNLLSVIGMQRGDIVNWPYIKAPNAIAIDAKAKLTARRLLLAEALVPVDNTSDWLTRIQTIKSNSPDREPFSDAMDGLAVLEAMNDEEEALAIALVMRETLETPDKTAALVTPDQALARRVKARLRRWSIDVDLSQGEPLEETSIGGFLAAIIDLVIEFEDPLALSALFNHPMTYLGQEHGAVKRKWQKLEKRVFRGIRPHASKVDEKDEDGLIALMRKALNPLIELGDKTSPELWAKALWTVAADMFHSEEREEGLWSVTGGAETQSVLQSMIDYGHNLPDISPRGLSKLLAVLMRGKVVRPPFGTHPRLSILGPLEARMLNADIIILGGLNEGVWPATPKIEPFLSRSMRQAVGLSLPEKRFGLSAHDFAELAANPNVILTRAKRSGGSPMVASRWLWRLTTLLEGALGADKAAQLLGKKNYYLNWAQQLDSVKPSEVKPAEAPQPRPKKEDRWTFRNGRSVSITQVKTWIRDPYSIFARHTLGLTSLEALDMSLGAGQFGTAIHDGLEKFLKDHQSGGGARDEASLIMAFKYSFAEAGYSPAEISKESARFANIAKDFLQWLKDRETDGFDVHAIESEANFTIDALNFTLTGKADLIERRPDGYGVIDYKTGTPASYKVVKAGFDPQLPLTAWLIAQGAFKDVPKGDTVQLGYVRVKGSNDDFSHRHLTLPEVKDGLSAEDYAEQAFMDLRELILSYDKPDTAYYSQPRIQYSHDYSEFDDLARRAEWAALGRDFGGGDFRA